MSKMPLALIPYWSVGFPTLLHSHSSYDVSAGAEISRLILDPVAARLSGGLFFLLMLRFGSAMGRNQYLCTACDKPRRFISSEPAAKRYEIRSYECPSCKSVLRIVERTERSMLPRRSGT